MVSLKDRGSKLPPRDIKKAAKWKWQSLSIWKCTNFPNFVQIHEIDNWQNLDFALKIPDHPLVAQRFGRKTTCWNTTLNNIEYTLIQPYKVRLYHSRPCTFLVHVYADVTGAGYLSVPMDNSRTETCACNRCEWGLFGRGLFCFFSHHIYCLASSLGYGSIKAKILSKIAVEPKPSTTNQLATIFFKVSLVIIRHFGLKGRAFNWFTIKLL